MFDKSMDIAGFDQELWKAMQGEAQRQEDHIDLIAAENHASPRVLAAQASVLTNKNAEGYPGSRYYADCAFVDQIEQLAIDRAKALFGAGFANVQPNSASQAKGAVCLAVLNPGDVILDLGPHAGRLPTDRVGVEGSRTLYREVRYGLDPDTGDIDYRQVEALVLRHRPKLIIAGPSTYPRTVDWQRFRAMADQVAACFLADIAQLAGPIVAGLYPSPVAIADVTTATTDTSLRGPRAGLILGRANPDLEKKINAQVCPGYQGGPLLHVIAAKAVAFKEALQPEFKFYQQQVMKNARVMVDTFRNLGVDMVSGGTDHHVFLVSLIRRGITGKALLRALGQAHITVKHHSVPNDPHGPAVTSGICIGTPAITTRGFREAEARQVAEWISSVIDNIDNREVIDRIRWHVQGLCRRFPIYPR